MQHSSAYHCLLENADKELNGSICNATFDGLLCWSPTPAGQTTSQRCPPYHGFRTDKFAYRKCDNAGEWEDINTTLVTLEKTNYEFCMGDDANISSDNFQRYTDELKRNVEIMNIVGISLLMISLLSVLLVIFLYQFVQPKFVNTILHVRIYKQIYATIILDITCKLTTHLLIYLQLQGIITVHFFSDVVCEALISLSHYSETVLLCWFMLDSHFLQIASRSGYLCASGYITYFIVGWGVPVVPVTVWIVSTTLSNKAKCWTNHSTSLLVWIVEIPKQIFIVTSVFLLLIALVRIHLDDYRKRIFDVLKLKTEIITTLILWLLITLSYLLVLFPTHIHSNASSTVQHIALVFASSRGIFISALYAFFNKNFRNYLMHNDSRLPCKKYLRLV